MEFLSKVSLSDKVRRDYIIKISFIGSVSLAGIILAIYSLIAGKFLYTIWYFAAFILGFSYVIIRINTAFPTYIAATSQQVVLSFWKNGVMPYTLPDKPTFISDFIPEKVKTLQIPMSDIDTVLIGSKKYLEKNLSPEEFPQILTRLSENKHLASAIKRMDFICIKTKFGDNCFMSVTDFDVQGLLDFVNTVEKYCNGVRIMTNIPKLVRMRNKIKS